MNIKSKIKEKEKNIPLGSKLTIRRKLMRKDNSNIPIKGKKITNEIVNRRYNYFDEKLTNSIEEFAKKFDLKLQKEEKINIISKYAEFLENDIDENVILYETFHGKSMTDNPYAIFLEILRTDSEKKYKHVWAINHDIDIDEQIKRYANISNIEFVEVNSDEYVYYLATAKFLINNTSFPPYFIRRKEQKYLNTWHGTPLKTLGKDMNGSVGQHKNLQRNFMQSTHIISPNKFTGDILIDSHDIDGIYSGKVIEEGYPRVDLITNTNSEEILDILSRCISIDSTKKIVLYAPTWRGEVGEVGDITNELIEKVNIIKKSLPKDYQLLLKVHPLLYRYIQDNKEISKMIIPDYYDVCEVMNIVDLLITDYSSIFIDFLIKDKPIILFQYDQDDYLKDRGVYFDLNSMSIPIAVSDEELKKLLIDIDSIPNNYLEKEKFVGLQKGNSTQKIVSSFIYEDDSNLNIRYFKNNKNNILVYLNSPDENKKQIINNLNYDEKNIILLISGRIDEKVKEFIEGIDERAKVFFNFDTMVFTPREWCEYQYLMKNQIHSELVDQSKVYFQREMSRIFNDLTFQKLIYMGSSKSKHYLNLMSCDRGFESKIIYLDKNDEEFYSTTKNKDIKYLCNSYDEYISMNQSILNLENSNTKLLTYKNYEIDQFPVVSFNSSNLYVVSVNETEGFLIDKKILDNDNLYLLIFRNNSASQVKVFFDQFYEDIYTPDSSYIFYSDESLKSAIEEKDMDNIIHISNSVNYEEILKLVPYANNIIDMSNVAKDNYFIDLYSRLNNETYLMKYDPQKILSSFNNEDSFLSITRGDVYTLEINNWFMKKQLEKLNFDEGSNNDNINRNDKIVDIDYVYTI